MSEKPAKIIVLPSKPGKYLREQAKRRVEAATIREVTGSERRASWGAWGTRCER
jgi:hypothetical protein